MSEELKPCPCCGGPITAFEYRDPNGSPLFKWMCHGCYLERCNFGSLESARADANLRAPDPVKYRLVETLESISNAQYHRWGDGFNTAEEFAAWAKSIAKSALAAAEGEKG